MGEVLGKFSNTIFKQMQEVEKAEVHLLDGRGRYCTPERAGSLWWLHRSVLVLLMVAQ